MSDERLRDLERELERQGRSLTTWAAQALGFGTIDPAALGARLLGFDDDPTKAARALRTNVFVRAFLDHVTREGHERLRRRVKGIEREVREHVSEPARRRLLERLDRLADELRHTTVALRPEPDPEARTRVEGLAQALEAEWVARVRHAPFVEAMIVELDGCVTCGEPSGMLNQGGMCPSCAHRERP